ncbi:hypothetical protein VRK_17080 [Vibrio sp. MEBiC08052]|nr:hypothetical protein VRK_17080 [Vibrio sp. MEBiC08052]
MIHLKTFESALSQADRLKTKKSQKVMSIMKEAYPSLSGKSDLELGRQVNHSGFETTTKAG